MGRADIPRQASQQHIYSYACGVNHRASISSGPVRALPERAEAGRRQTPMPVWRQKDSPASHSPHLTRPQPSAPRARGHACAVPSHCSHTSFYLSSLRLIALVANAHLCIAAYTDDDVTCSHASNSLTFRVKLLHNNHIIRFHIYVIEITICYGCGG